LDNVIIS